MAEAQQGDHTALMDQIIAAFEDTSEESIVTFCRLLEIADRVMTDEEWNVLHDRILQDEGHILNCPVVMVSKRD